MDTGISIYPGLRGSIREKTGLIEEAAALGIHRLFTSFHIPETDAAAFHEELDAVLASARENSMDVVADISPASASLLGMDRFEPVNSPNSALRRSELTTASMPKNCPIQSGHKGPAQRLDLDRRKPESPPEKRSSYGCHRRPP